jgi:hypothetical protein
MQHSVKLWAWTLATIGVVAAFGRADVVVRGPLGGGVTVASPSGVYVGPSGVVVAQPPPPVVVVPVAPVPQPAAVLPQDFARTFQPMPGHYSVTFVHTRTNQPVTVAFDLPQGSPRVYYAQHSLVFDYGRHEVEIRFAIGGKARVIQK